MLYGNPFGSNSGGGGTEGTVNANDVAETLSKQFISALEKQQITANKNSINSLRNEIDNIEDDIVTSMSPPEKLDSIWKDTN